MDDVVTLHGTAGAWTLPLDVPISAFDLLAAFVELESPVTLKQVEKLKTYAAKESQELARLEEYCKPDVFKADIGDKRVDLLSLVEELERLDMPFTDFLIAMPSIKMRQVSRRRPALYQAATMLAILTVIVRSDSTRSLRLPLTIPDEPHSPSR
jgi:cytochrome P450/NADPH-cytochrome P450 reductase